MPVVFPILAPIDQFILEHPVSPVLCILLPLLLCVCYPKRDGWTTTWADTCIILGCAAGVGLGQWFNNQWVFIKRPHTPPPYPIIMPDVKWLFLVIFRLVVGAFILMLTRAVAKKVTFKVMCHLTGMNEQDPRAQQTPTIQVMQKYITYTLVALSAVVVAPQVFKLLAVERVTFFTEG